MILVIPHIANKETYVPSTKHACYFSWQGQYSVVVQSGGPGVGEFTG